MSNMTGLESLQALIDGKSPPVPMSQVIPMKLIEVEYGIAIFEAQADERHLNPLGLVHGGFAATVLDSSTACAIITALEESTPCITIDLAVKMVRPLPKNTRLLSKARIINVSKSLGTAEATIKDETGKLYAYGSASCMIKSAK